MEYILVFVISYLIGNISPAIIVGKKIKGVDIREINSKNAGTSNITMSIGYRWGLFVGITDILKGFIPVMIIKYLFPDNDILWFLGGLAVIVGHVYPVFYKFKAGKGTATFGGVLFAVAPLYAFGLLISFFLILLITDYIALSTLFAIIVTPIALLFMDFSYISVLLMIVYSFISFIKHYINFKRIINKEELGLRRFKKLKRERDNKEKGIAW